MHAHYHHLEQRARDARDDAGCRVDTLVEDLEAELEGDIKRLQHKLTSLTRLPQKEADHAGDTGPTVAGGRADSEDTVSAVLQLQAARGPAVPAGARPEAARADRAGDEASARAGSHSTETEARAERATERPAAGALRPAEEENREEAGDVVQSRPTVGSSLVQFFWWLVQLMTNTNVDADGDVDQASDWTDRDWTDWTDRNRTDWTDRDRTDRVWTDGTDRNRTDRTVSDRTDRNRTDRTVSDRTDRLWTDGTDRDRTDRTVSDRTVSGDDERGAGGVVNIRLDIDAGRISDAHIMKYLGGSLRAHDMA